MRPLAKLSHAKLLYIGPLAMSSSLKQQLALFFKMRMEPFSEG